MLTKTKTTRRARLNATAEEVSIQHGIALDPDNPDTAGDAVQTERVFSRTELVQLRCAQSRARREIRMSAPLKQSVTIRLSPEVVEYFRATGAGWQTRMDGVLKGYVKRSTAAKAR